MQFEVQKSVIVKAISNVNGAVEKKNTIPVLQNIKIDVVKSAEVDDNVTLSATDMDILITSNFVADVKSSGSTTVPAQMFFDIIRKIPDSAPIMISQDSKNNLQIKSGKSKYTLPCIEASEFPSLSEGEMSEEITISAEELVNMIERTRFAISNDETRYYLNGLYLHSLKREDGFELRTVATDGHRMALAIAKAEGIKSEFGAIIPKRSVAEIRRVVDGADKIKISISRIKIKVVADQSTIISKLIDGEFPDYDKVLPKNNDKIVVANQKAFYDAVDRVSTIATDRHRSVKLILTSGQVSLQVNTNEGGSAHEEIEVNYSGEEIQTGFNSRYLLDIVGHIEKEEFLARFKDGNSPILIEAKDMNAVFVIMPVKV